VEFGFKDDRVFNGAYGSVQQVVNSIIAMCKAYQEAKFG
jgi:hypothetical protein